jgi:hypothetical protein
MLLLLKKRCGSVEKKSFVVEKTAISNRRIITVKNATDLSSTSAWVFLPLQNSHYCGITLLHSRTKILRKPPKKRFISHQFKKRKQGAGRNTIYVWYWSE